MMGCGILFFLNHVADKRFENEKKNYKIYKEAKKMFSLGEYDKAEKKYQLCLDNGDYESNCADGLMQIYYKKQEWEKAISFTLDRISGKEPPSTEDRYGWYRIAKLYDLKLNNKSKAKEYYLKTERWLSHPALFMDIAKIYKEENNFNEATVYAQKALAELSQPGYHYSDLTKDDTLKLLSEIKSQATRGK